MEQAGTARAPAGIEIRGVNLSYGATHVLKNIDLSVRPGEFFAFLGPSGCGKTTLLRLIAGFNTAQTGEVRVGGTEISGLPPWKRDVGMVFQSYALWPHMSVARNVAFGLEERRVPREAIDRRVRAALELVGLGAFADRRPAQLSGGQQQRVALARTIVVEPKVLLLDEPLSNLDAKMRVQVRRELRDLQQRLGVTTIFVTHDQEEANTVCDRIAVMNEGRVEQVGTPMELYERPATLFVAGFLGSANILDGAVEAGSGGALFRLGDGTALPLAATPEASARGGRVVFRPHDVALLAAAQPRPAGAMAGQVVHREFLGSAVRYAVAAGGREVLAERPFHSGEELVDVGAKVWLAVPPSHLRVLAA